MQAQTSSAKGKPNLSPEFTLLLACARTALRPAGIERIGELCQDPIDWPLLLGLVARHRVAQSSGGASRPLAISQFLMR